MVIEGNSRNMFKRHCLKNWKHSLKLLLDFWIYAKFCAFWSKKISFIALIFCRSLGLRNVVTWMPESSCFRTALQSERVHVPQTPVKSTRQQFYPKFPLIQDKLSSKTSLLVRFEVLGVFGKRLTADHKYFRRNWEKFLEHVETPLSSKIENIF